MRSTSEKSGGRKIEQGTSWKRLLTAAAALVLATAPAGGGGSAWAAEGDEARTEAIETPYTPVNEVLRDGVLSMNKAILDKVEIQGDNITYMMGYGPPLGSVDVYYRLGNNTGLNTIGTARVKAEGWWEIRLTNPIHVVGFENAEPVHFCLCWTPLGGQQECSEAKNDPDYRLTLLGWDATANNTSDPRVTTWNLRTGAGNWPKILRTFIVDGPNRTEDDITNDIREAQANIFDNPRDPVPERIGVGFGNFCSQGNPLHLCMPDISLTVSSNLEGAGSEFQFVMLGLLSHDIGRSILMVQKRKRPEIPDHNPPYRSLFFESPLRIDMPGVCGTIRGTGEGVVSTLFLASVPAFAFTLRRLRRRGRTEVE